MRRWLALIMAAVLFAGVAGSAYGQEPGEGVISGQVVNGTAGGGSVAGVEITLLTYIDDSLADTVTTVTDDDGKFRFDGVNPAYEYLVSARYLEVDYYNQVEFESGTMEANLEVGVCDTTASDDLISSGLTRKIIDVGEESLLITELHWLFNDGDKTYLRPDGVLDFTMPAGAFGFQAPEQLVIDFQLLGGDRVTYLVPFPPGERQLVYAYSLAKPDTADFAVPLTLDYPTEGLEVWISGQDIEATVTQLAPADPVVTDSGASYICFQGTNLPAGTVIDLRLSDLSAGGFPQYVIWIIMAAVIIGIAFYLMRRKRSTGGK
jgi:hypothetical protein